jgi:hypothetical protein
MPNGAVLRGGQAAANIASRASPRRVIAGCVIAGLTDAAFGAYIIGDGSLRG